MKVFSQMTELIIVLLFCFEGSSTALLFSSRRRLIISVTSDRFKGHSYELLCSEVFDPVRRSLLVRKPRVLRISEELLDPNNRFSLFIAAIHQFPLE